MRLRICVHRHELPPVKLLIKAPEAQPTPISKLLDQVNLLVPLESEGWGLEDYVVTVQGYECLHYIDLHSILHEDDEVSIRALQSSDIKARRVSGRIQISHGGVHLLDGIAFGRQALRRTHRPEVYIPPLKRRRLTEDVAEESQSVVGDENQLGQSKTITDAEDADQGEEGRDHLPQGRNYTEIDKDVVNGAGNGRKEHLLQPLRRRAKQSTTRRASVQFTEPAATLIRGRGGLSNEENEDEEDEDEDADFNPEEDDESETSDGDSLSEDEIVENQSLSMSSSDPESSLDSSSISSDSSSDDSSDDADETATSDIDTARQLEGVAPVVAKTLSNKTTQTGGIPGQGKKNTWERNKRRREKKRLDYLKKTGILHSEATLADMRLYEAEQRGDIPSKFEVYGRFEASKTPPPNTDTPANADTADLVSQRVQTAVDALHSNSPAANLELLTELLHPPPREADVQVPSSPSGSDPPDEMPATLISTRQISDTSSLSPAARQSRLDVASSRRLLFGSLGVRAPRSKEDEERLRTRLGRKVAAKDRTRSTPKTVEGNSRAEAPEPEDGNDVSDAWKTRVNLTAVECVEEGIILTAPPFPFQQRWDPQQQSRGKKRKRPSQTEAQLHHQDDEEEWAGLDYDDPVPVPENLPAEDASPELPNLPADLASYPRPSRDDCKRGAVIAFTRMEVSKATRWQPGISPVRTARIQDVDDEILVLSLAKRDRLQAQYDEEGSRVYDKLEMPAADGTDEGTMDVAFEELVDAYLLQPGTDVQADNESFIPDSVPADAHATGSDAESDEQAARGLQQRSQGEESQELQAAQHQIPTASASDDSYKVIEASA